MPVVSARMYCITQPTPVASGPSIGWAPSRQLVAHAVQVLEDAATVPSRDPSPSSKTTYTADRPN